MPPETPPITDSNQEILDLVREVNERTARMESELLRLLGAWNRGGLRGLRNAAGGNSNGRG